MRRGVRCAPVWTGRRAVRARPSPREGAFAPSQGQALCGAFLDALRADKGS